MPITGTRPPRSPMVSPSACSRFSAAIAPLLERKRGCVRMRKNPLRPPCNAARVRGVSRMAVASGCCGSCERSVSTMMERPTQTRKPHGPSRTPASPVPPAASKGRPFVPEHSAQRGNAPNRGSSRPVLHHRIRPSPAPPKMLAQPRPGRASAHRPRHVPCDRENHVRIWAAMRQPCVAGEAVGAAIPRLTSPAPWHHGRGGPATIPLAGATGLKAPARDGSSAARPPLWGLSFWFDLRNTRLRRYRYKIGDVRVGLFRVAVYLDWI